MSAVGDRIRQQRQKLGFTQERLASDALMSKGFLSEVETGNRNPSAEYLLRIASALGVSLDYLMKGEAAPTPEVAVKRVPFPESLTKFALEKRLPFDIVKALLDAKLQIVANRRDETENDLEKINWAGFYEAVKDYL